MGANEHKIVPSDHVLLTYYVLQERPSSSSSNILLGKWDT